MTSVRISTRVRPRHEGRIDLDSSHSLRAGWFEHRQLRRQFDVLNSGIYDIGGLIDAT
jgi:hypothetical protein